MFTYKKAAVRTYKLKKRYIALIFIAFLLTLALAVHYFTNYFGFKTVDVEPAGTIRVPKEWVMTVSSDRKQIYFADSTLLENGDGIIETQGATVYLKNISAYFGENEKEKLKMEYVETLWTYGYSNSTVIKAYSFKDETGSLITEYSLGLIASRNNGISLYSLSIKDDLLKKIAKSYKMY